MTGTGLSGDRGLTSLGKEQLTLVTGHSGGRSKGIDHGLQRKCYVEPRKLIFLRLHGLLEPLSLLLPWLLFLCHSSEQKSPGVA